MSIQRKTVDITGDVRRRLQSMSAIKGFRRMERDYGLTADVLNSIITGKRNTVPRETFSRIAACMA